MNHRDSLSDGFIACYILRSRVKEVLGCCAANRSIVGWLAWFFVQVLIRGHKLFVPAVWNLHGHEACFMVVFKETLRASRLGSYCLWEPCMLLFLSYNIPPVCKEKSLENGFLALIHERRSRTDVTGFGSKRNARQCEYDGLCGLLVISNSWWHFLD